MILTVCMQYLTDNSISCVPVWDDENKEYAGLVDVCDLSACLALIIEAEMEALGNDTLDWNHSKIVNSQQVGQLIGFFVSIFFSHFQTSLNKTHGTP